MPAHADPLRIALQVGLYIFFFILTSWLFVLAGFGTVFGIWIGSALGTFVGAVVANVVTLRIYEGRRLADIGFHWNRASAHNLLWGLAGGIAAAVTVLAGPLALRLASLVPGTSVEGQQPNQCARPKNSRRPCSTTPTPRGCSRRSTRES